MKYIPDKEINLDEHGDLIGTKPYVDSLYSVIKSCDTPFTIGLLGGWGVGKSSIAKTLQERINNNQEEDVKVFIYNAWKYSGDSFRRTFLLELLNFFKIERASQLSNFYENKYVERTFGISKIIKYESKKGTNIPLAFAPEQFQEIFNEIIKELTSPNRLSLRWVKTKLGISEKLKKVVIIIDNIDRCHKELATKLLLTVKNFLEVKNCIFILPIDEQGIKKFLGMTSRDADEFLRKLFDTTIKIRYFSDLELYDFALKLNEKYELGFSPNVISLIAQEFSKNPRRIIQFLNNLHSEKMLAENQEKNGAIPKGSITNHSDMLAKILIIEEEWPDLYKEIYDNKTLLRELNNSFKTGNWVLNDKIRKLENDLLPIKLSEEQHRFLIKTQYIDVDHLEPFFINRDMFKGIPDELNKLALSQDWDSIKKLIQEDVLSLGQLFEFIFQKLDEEVIKRKLYEPSGFNLISLILKIFSDKDYRKKFEEIYKNPHFSRVKAVIDASEIKNLLLKFNSEHLIGFAFWLDNKNNSTLRNNIIAVISEFDSEKLEDSHVEFIKRFIDCYKEKENILQNIKSKFSELLEKNFDIYETFKEYIKDTNITKYLVNDSVIDSSIDSINKDLSQDHSKDKVDFLMFLQKSELLSQEQIDAYVVRTLPFLNDNNWNNMLFWLDALARFITKSGESTHQEIFNTLNNRYQFLFSQYTARHIDEINIKCYKLFLNLCKELYVVSEEYNSQIISWLNGFFARNESPEIYLHVNKIYQEIIDHFDSYNWDFAPAVIQRFSSLPDFEHKKGIAQTLIKMLLNTSEKEGLDKNQINQTIELFFQTLFLDDKKQSKEAKNWLSVIIKSDFIKGFVKTKMETLDKPEQQRKIIGLVFTLEDRKLMQDIISSVIKSADNYEQLKKWVIRIKRYKDSPKFLKNALIGLLNDIKTEEIDYYKDVVRVCVKNQELFSKTNIGKIINKLRPLLASDNKEEQLFGVKMVKQLEVIPENKKSLLKTLLSEIEFKGKRDKNLLQSAIRGISKD